MDGRGGFELAHGQIHQQFRFLTGNQCGRRRLKQQIPPGTEPHQVLQGNIPVKVALPQIRKRLKGLLQGDGARGVQQQPLQARPMNATGQIKQPIEISRGATPGELLTPPLQHISAGHGFAVCQGRGLRQCNPDSHSSSP